MMVSGDAEAFAQVRAMLERITGRLFALGPRPGDASTFKIVNNLLAAANLAAGAEALALAHAAGLDLRQVLDVVAASSGASWIFGDRVPRALDGDYAPARGGEAARQGRRASPRRSRSGSASTRRSRASRTRRSPRPLPRIAATRTMRF